MKPNLKIAKIEVLEVEADLSPVEKARKRFGKKFVHESGTTWSPRQTPLLTEWMATRATKEK